MKKEPSNQLYERKHNPFVSYQDVQNNPARMGNIVDFSQFATDLASGNVADYTVAATPFPARAAAKS